MKLVNDIHSKLNETLVRQIVYPRSIKEIQTAIANAKNKRAFISIAGGRHAMGGQQFGKNAVLLDMSKMNKVLNFDASKGLVEVESGIQWPKLVDYLLRIQKGKTHQWAVVQKQTGTATLSIGGAVSANAHGRAITQKPFIDQVDSLVLINADGKAIRCSRKENKELFRLVIGGYGLFGVIVQVTLRLWPRVKVERVVEIVKTKDLMSKLNRFIKKGVLYADFQYSIDKKTGTFLREGILPHYRPVSSKVKLSGKPIKLTLKQWRELYFLAHVDAHLAYEKYCQFYLSTSGQVYWSDVSDMTDYIEGYHGKVDQQLGLKNKSSEMITEVYVLRNKLVNFLEVVRKDFLKFNVPLIYGVVRVIKKDDESFLAWAKEDYACVIFNLHVEHTRPGIKKSATDFRRLIDKAILYKGSFYLTYHRWASQKQILKCYPQFIDFLKLKLKYDSSEVFQSDWYKHYKKMFKNKIGKF
jgi:hypothetical protein